MTRPSLPRPVLRRMAAALSLHLLLAACSATAHSPQPQPQPATQPALWPDPKPIAGPAQWPVLRNTPNFQAPSAQHCARPVHTREIPGAAAGQASAYPAHPSRHERLAKAAPSHSASPAPAPAPAPSAALAAPARAAAEGAADMASERRAASPAWPTPQPQVQAQPQPDQTVTAGMVDDNADFSAYLAFRARTRVEHRARDIRERHLLEVRDAQGRSVPDAEVAVQGTSGHAMWARTDAGGHVWLHPGAFDPARSAHYDIVVRKDGRQSSTRLVRGQQSAAEVRLPDMPVPQRARLDLVFLIDATGSMADEIGKLKTTLRSIAAEVAALPSQPDLCFGLVAYRDRGDAFMLRSHDFTNDLGAFQGVLNALQAGGGGDYPEAMNEALHDTVHNLSWRGDGATRMVVLLADAPPHLDYGGPQYDDDMVAALGKGIKVFSVGASGLDRQGEYIQRQIAQYTGGRFVFLTYANARQPASGPGRETVHDVKNYSVDTLDRLVVRLVAEELGKLPRGG